MPNLQGRLHGSLQASPVQCHVVSDEELLVPVDVPGADDAEDVPEPGMVALHVEHVPLRVVVDEVTRGGV